MNNKQIMNNNSSPNLRNHTDMDITMDDLTTSYHDRSKRILSGQPSLSNQDVTHNPTKGEQGFGSMDPSTRRTIASQGEKVAHEQGEAHEWNSEEAKHEGEIGRSR